MGTISFGVKLVWKESDVPHLPNGWTTRKNEREPFIAISPEGSEYAIGDGVLYPWRTWPSNGNFRPGEHYVATTEAIPFPT